MGIRNSARPTRNENIEIENVSSPSQTLSLIRNLQINQPTLKNQNETLGIKIFQKQTLLVILIQLPIVSGCTDASGSVSEASAQVMNLKMEPAKKTPLYVII